MCVWVKAVSLLICTYVCTVRTYLYITVHACVCIVMYVYAYACMYVRTLLAYVLYVICTYVFVQVWMCVHVRMCMCISVCLIVCAHCTSVHVHSFHHSRLNAACTWMMFAYVVRAKHRTIWWRYSLSLEEA